MSTLIPELKFEVCGACQNHCFSCAHDGMMSAYRTYQLSIDELDYFVECTKASDYYIELLSVHGMGEPLLWKHFNEGIRRLSRSGVVGRIAVTTNGLLLDRIEDETWECIDELRLSLYDNFDKGELLGAMLEKYGDRIKIEPMTMFRAKLVKGYENRIPCACSTAGPMFVKDKIFWYCGPPVFDAALLMGINLSARTELFTDLAPGYLDRRDSSKTGNMQICNFCWANSSLHVPSYPWGYEPSDVTLAVDTAIAGALHGMLPRRVRANLNTINGSLKRAVAKTLGALARFGNRA